jgi:hypothetical protein
MVTLSFRFLACDALTGASLGYLDLQDVTFNGPVTGVAQLTGKAYVQPSQDRDTLDQLTQPDQVALYAVAGGTYWWGGVIQSRPWDPASRSRTITAMAWKGWLALRFIGPNAAANPVSDVTYTNTNTDQLVIARSILAAAIAGNGTPNIMTGAELSGVNRDLNWLATRGKGFEWNIEVRPDNLTGHPTLWFVPYYPARGSGQPAISLTVRSAIALTSTGKNGNCSIEGTIDDSAVNRRTRVWATGKGTPPDQLMAFDDDPDLAADLSLIKETKTGYTSISAVTTLAANARAERVFRSVPTSQVTVRATFAEVDPTRYGSGDRVQLFYQDEGVTLDFDAVRIVDVAITVNSGQIVDSALLTIDLSDNQLPDNSAEV